MKDYWTMDVFSFKPMVTHTFRIFYFICLLAHRAHSSFDTSCTLDIYTGSHLEALLVEMEGQGSNIAMHNMALLLYTPGCESVLDSESNLSRFPPRFVTFRGKHDYQTVPRHMSARPRGKDSLRKRYRSLLKDCAAGLFFKKGGSIDAPEVWYPGSTSFTDWVWFKTKVILSIRKAMMKTIRIKFLGDGPEMSDIVIDHNSKVTMRIYTSYHMICTEESTGDFVYGRHVTEQEEGADIVLTATLLKFPKNLRNYLEEQKTLVGDIERNLEMRQRRLAEMFLHSNKQFLLLTKLSLTGHEVITLPKTHYHEVYREYMKSRTTDRIQREEFLWPRANDDRIIITEVPLMRPSKSALAKAIKPFAEKFCQCKLKVTAAVGVLEFHHGHNLRQHTDKPDKGVIAAILVVNLEKVYPALIQYSVVSLTGERETVQLRQGQMLLIESAARIHGFQKTFIGDTLALMYIFYKPHTWDWYTKTVTLTNFEETFLIKGPGFGVIEPMGAFITHNNVHLQNQTAVMRSIRTLRDEL